MYKYNRTSYNPQIKVWSGCKFQTIYNSEASLGHLILNVLKKTPEMVTQVSADTNAEMTCHEMRKMVITMSSYLNANGYKQGDIVGFMARNSENLAPVVFACFALGLPIHFLSQAANEKDIIAMFAKTKPKIIFCDGDITGTLQIAINKMGLSAKIFTFMSKVNDYEFVDDIVSGGGVHDFVYPELENVSNSIAIILCSSGTTGEPKGICKSHKQIIKQMHPMWNLNMETRGEVYLNFSTLHWLSGFLFLINSTLYGGKRIITTRDFSVDLFLDICDRFKVTTFNCVTSIIVKISQSKNLKPINSLKACMAGGTVVSRNLSEAIRPFLPNDLIATYGTTEGDFLSGSFDSPRYGSNGQLCPNIQMKIIDEAGNNLGPNENGEICYKTPVLFSGYFDDPEETNSTVIEGWVHSGDIGYFDEEEFLFVVDRKTDMLGCNDIVVWPSEIETIIKEIEGVYDACVVGVYEEDKGDDLIYGFVIKDPSNEKLTEKVIKDYVNGKIDNDGKKLRGGVHFVDAFPLTFSAKIKRVAMRKIAQEHYDSKINN